MTLPPPLKDTVPVVKCDTLVVGSGAGGLSAAVSSAHHGLDTIVAEKADVFGGTTARSGGWLWIPCNEYQREAGMPDSRDEALTYLKHETGEHFDAARISGFLDNGPKMLKFFAENTALAFQVGPTFADYHCDAPGGKPGGRSVVAQPFDGRKLGDAIHTLREPLPELTLLGLMIGSGEELWHFFNATRSPRSMMHVIKLCARYGWDKLTYKRGMRLTNGNALAGRLLRSAMDKQVQLWSGSPVTELVVVNDRVCGAFVERPQGRVKVMARRGVVLAAGGFPHDIERRRALFPHAPTGHEHTSPAPESNTGDGIALGETVGGRSMTELPNAAAWVPVSKVPRRDGSTGIFPHFVDRSKPGVIAVNRHGKRFVNESNSYHDFVQALCKSYKSGDGGEDCAWFIADHRTVRRYGLGFAKGSPLPMWPYLRSGYLIRGNTLEQLAHSAGFDAAGFVQTVTEFNGPAARGEDPQFARGSTAYNRSLGDPSHEPNPCVAPIQKGPFYAVKVVIGDLGTYAGLQTNEHARVVRPSGEVIDGLYAAGNDAGSIMGGNYPGGGITLGPAMTFGWIAANHMANEFANLQSDDSTGLSGSTDETVASPARTTG